MFTLADIRNIAVQIEKNGEEVYRRAAEAAQDENIASLLLRMADDEQRHGRWFCNSIDTDRELTEQQREMEEAGRTILQEMVKDRTFSLNEQRLGASRNVEELLAQAQAFEEDTVLFYEMLLGFVDDEGTKDQLLMIIEEERRHSEELARLLGL